MTHHFTNRLVNLLLLVISSSTLNFMLNSCENKKEVHIGQFNFQSDIGFPKLEGSASFDSISGEYHLAGAGENIWFDKDEFQFISQKITGDFILTARIKFIGEGENEHRKIGIMVREELFGGAAHVSAVVHGDGLAALQFRPHTNSNTEEVRSELSAPNIIRLERQGQKFTFSMAVEGEAMQSIGLDESDLSQELYLGLFVCSHDKGVLEEAVFDNVRLSIPAPNDFVPYKDYIGSHIEILDLESGKRNIIFSSPKSLQAPNWSPDGQLLYYNCEGKIYALNLADYSSKEIDTGLAQNNNNDHVLSFDGQLLGISDHTEDPNDASLIYTLPAAGGTPERLTNEGPSYLHGFSPDKQFAVFTGGRNNAAQLDLYKIELQTKEEIQLTDTPGLDDGSEYSADGQFIYFCSTRTGTMQVYRMNADGSEQTQLTFDEFNDWFPHVSPDGSQLVFISYPQEIAADDHPFYKRVAIRTMPAKGGTPTVIAYLYGGQGSMNVFNWSPDGKKIAFVSNTVIE
ncbi:PD40 domain-containing protein [Mangrovibacterium lignilyticum]|uniref:PD40 domain-containing protein n=1 Tax=Mangrovibacterium lignilyticum TaxID=2668052 RepID=UPI0013D5206B|nr:PD40 domain-containing protein [Mangrovibacterium lignilyticum]